MINIVPSVNKLLNYDKFLDKSIYDIIMKDYNTTYFTAFGDNSLWITVKNNQPPPPVEYVGKVVQRVSSMKECYSIFSNGRSKNTNIYIWMTDFKKKLPTKRGNSLTPLNVNSGYTVINSGDIFIWRSEELLKVLTHEMIHSLKYDAKINNSCGTLLSEMYNISGDINLGESYVETMATVINCNNSFDCLKKEMDFSRKQLDKILWHYGFEGLSQLLRTSENTMQLNQGTHVFSYYIIKTVLLNNIREFLKFEKEVSQGKNMSNDDITFLYYNLVNKSFQKYLNKYPKISSNKIANNSLKMTQKN